MEHVDVRIILEENEDSVMIFSEGQEIHSTPYEMSTDDGDFVIYSFEAKPGKCYQVLQYLNGFPVGTDPMIIESQTISEVMRTSTYTTYPSTAHVKGGVVF